MSLPGARGEDDSWKNTLSQKFLDTVPLKSWLYKDFSVHVFLVLNIHEMKQSHKNMYAGGEGGGGGG